MIIIAWVAVSGHPMIRIVVATWKSVIALLSLINATGASAYLIDVMRSRIYVRLHDAV